MESELKLSLCVTERSIFVTEIKAQLARRHVALALDRPCNRRLFLFCSYACASIDTSVWFCASKILIAIGYKKSEGNLWLSINPESSQHYIRSFNGPLSGTTRVSWYKKGKTSLDFTEAQDSEWQWYQLGHMQVCTSLHASTPPLSFLQAGCPSCHPTNSIKALKALLFCNCRMFWRPTCWCVMFVQVFPGEFLHQVRPVPLCCQCGFPACRAHTKTAAVWRRPIIRHQCLLTEMCGRLNDKQVMRQLTD